MLDNEFPDRSSQAELYMLPPVFTLSDEDSDDKDKLQSLNHLSEKQLAAPLKVVIHASTDHNDHIEHYHDSALDQPSSKRTKADQQSAGLKHPRKSIEQDIESQQPKHPEKHIYSQKDRSPVECFE